MQFKLKIKFTNKVSLSDDLRVIEVAVIAQRESVLMTTIMLNSSIQPTTLQCVWTGCTQWGLWNLLMLRHETRADWTGYGTLSMLGYINEKSGYVSTCSELPTECAEMSPCWVIHRSENSCISWSEIVTPQSFCMQLSIDTNYSFIVNNNYMSIQATREQLHFYNERQWSVNDFWICKQLNRKVICSLLFIFNRQAACAGKRDRGAVTATFWYLVSMECQRYFLW